MGSAFKQGSYLHATDFDYRLSIVLSLCPDARASLPRSARSVTVSDIATGHVRRPVVIDVTTNIAAGVAPRGAAATLF